MLNVYTKNNKNGFTLIELLGVITIFGILCALAIPPILNQVNKNKNVISEANLKIIYHATHLYFAGETEASDSYCVTLQELVDRNLLESPLQDFENDKEISLSRSVQMITDANKKETYQLLAEGASCGIKSYAIADKVSVKGIDGYFNVIEDSGTDSNKVKLLYQDSISSTNFGYDITTYAGSNLAGIIDTYQNKWRQKIEASGGTTDNFVLDAPRKEDIDAILRRYNYDPSLVSSTNQTNIPWLNTMTFYTKTIMNEGSMTYQIFKLYIYTSLVMSYGSHGYYTKMDLPATGTFYNVRPVVTVNKSNVTKVS